MLGVEIICRGGPAAELQGYAMGRYEPIIGEERDGFQVYKQAHSREIPNYNKLLLYR